MKTRYKVMEPAEVEGFWIFTYGDVTVTVSDARKNSEEDRESIWAAMKLADDLGQTTIKLE